jgi:hypothetical protein
MSPYAAFLKGPRRLTTLFANSDCEPFSDVRWLLVLLLLLLSVVAVVVLLLPSPSFL